MRVLIITQYFYPENFKSSDIAFELACRGYEVDALVGIPNYPEGHYKKGYGIFHKRKEKILGVNIYRAFQTPRGEKGTNVGLALNYISYVISSCLWILLCFLFKKKYDAIIVFQTSPITQAIPAVLLKKIKQTPIYLWVLDVWPDSFISSMPQNKGKILSKIFSNLTEWIYHNSKKILISSSGMAPLICRKHDYSAKIEFFPNWCDDILAMPNVGEYSLPDNFIVMMAGNIADGIGIPFIISVLDFFKNDKRISFVFVGGGSLQDTFRKDCKERGLNNVYFTGQVPFEHIPHLYAKASAMFLSLKKTDLLHLKVTIPARLQSYMSAGKPIVAMIDYGGQELIEKADCGYYVPAGDSQGMIELINRVLNQDRQILILKGLNGRKYNESHFKKGICISNLEKILQQK